MTEKAQNKANKQWSAGSDSEGPSMSDCSVTVRQDPHLKILHSLE